MRFFVFLLYLTKFTNGRFLELLPFFSSVSFFADFFSTLFLDGFSLRDRSFFNGTAISLVCVSIFSRAFERLNEEIAEFPVCAIGAFAALKIKSTQSKECVDLLKKKYLFLLWCFLFAFHSSDRLWFNGLASDFTAGILIGKTSYKTNYHCVQRTK